MKIKLWGVRGSLASPLMNEEYSLKIHEILELSIKSGLRTSDDIAPFMASLPDNLQFVYGGNTTCASVTSASGRTYIIDCGSGIRPLGYELMNGPLGKGNGKIDIFITHNHWDHIQGLPFFLPLYMKGNVLTFYSPYAHQEDYLKYQMNLPFFPAPFDSTGSSKKFFKIDLDSNLPIEPEKGLLIDLHPLKHPGGSFAYKFSENGKSFIFATDAEFTGVFLENMPEKTEHFFSNADLLVLDAQYTLDESFSKFDWGHTSFTMAVNCGLRWKVKNLVLTHHEPAYSDNKLFENYRAAIGHRNHSQEINMNLFMAREGFTFEI